MRRTAERMEQRLDVPLPATSLQGPAGLGLLACTFIVGLVLVAGMVPFNGPDEPYHWLRAVQIASGQWLPDDTGGRLWGGPIDAANVAYAEWFKQRILSATPTTLGEAWAQAGHLAASATGTQVVAFPSSASFSPLAYLPQAAGIALAKALGANPLAQLWAGRTVNLVGYLGMVWLILRTLPAAHQAFLIIALLPSGLHVVGSLSADPLNFTLPALLFAAVWRARALAGVDAPRNAVTSLAGIAVLVLLLGLLKPIYVVLGLVVLLLPPSRFASPRARHLFIAGTIGAATLATLAWNLTHPFVPGQYWGTGASPGAVLQAARLDPAAAWATWSRSLRELPAIMWLDGHGRFGGYPAPLMMNASAHMSWLSFNSLLVVLLTERAPRRDLPAAGLFMALAIAFTAALALAFWLGFTPVQAPRIEGMQGRYFTLVYLMAACSIACLSLTKPHPAWRYIRHIAFGVALAAGLATLAIGVQYMQAYWIVW